MSLSAIVTDTRRPGKKRCAWGFGFNLDLEISLARLRVGVVAVWQMMGISKVSLRRLSKKMDNSKGSDKGEVIADF